MSMPVKVEGLEVCVSGVQLLSDIEFALGGGEILAVLGANGAGKSTLLRALAGELSWTKGSISLFGRDARFWHGQSRARQVAVLPQSSTLNFAFTAENVVAMGRMPHDSGVRVDEQIVFEAMARLDIGHLRGRLYPSLSGGEKQRVQLARVLVQIWREEDAGPRLLLLDEPSSALDLGHQQAFLKEVEAFAREGVAVIMVVHDVNAASQCADQVLALTCGRVAAAGPANKVLTPGIVGQVLRAEVSVVRHPKTGRPFFLW